jgi:hypothetical protein
MALGDKYEGDIYVREGMTVEGDNGMPSRVDGTQRTNRDLSTKVSWWELRPRTPRDIPPRPVDENGVPQVLCSAGHYRPRRAFDTNMKRPNGLQAYCKQCRHEQYLRQSAEAAERSGKPLRRYHERKHV